METRDVARFMESMFGNYGMRRKDAEKVLGTGSVGITNSYTYESGVSVLYRDDKAVAITLQRESQGYIEHLIFANID